MPTSDGRIIVAVDFDGTLSGEGKFPEAGEPDVELIAQLRNYKAKYNIVIIIFTCRTSQEHISHVKIFCEEHNCPYDKINENYEALIDFGFPKIFADIYVDDRARTPEEFKSRGLDGIVLKDDKGKETIPLAGGIPAQTVDVEITSLPLEVADKIIKEHFQVPERKVALEVKKNGKSAKVFARLPKSKNFHGRGF